MKSLAVFLGAVLSLLFLGACESSAAPCSTIPNNLVNNCGFETGTLAGWTVTGNDVPVALNNLYGVEGVDPLDGISPHSGTSQFFSADLASNAITLSQTLSTTAGKGYLIMFDLAQDTVASAMYPNILSVVFNGVTLTTLNNIPVEGYTQYSFFGAATSASTVFSITLGNGLGESLLDDVSVTLAPEPSAGLLTLAGGLAAVHFLRRRYQKA